MTAAAPPPPTTKMTATVVTAVPEKRLKQQKSINQQQLLDIKKCQKSQSFISQQVHLAVVQVERAESRLLHVHRLPQDQPVPHPTGQSDIEQLCGCRHLGKRRH